MHTTAPQPFEWPHASAIHELMARRWAVDDPRAQMHIGDCYWTLRSTSTGEMTADAWMWQRTDGTLDAFAWLDLPELADFVLAPDAPSDLTGDILDWLESRLREYGAHNISCVVIEGDLAREHALQARGHAPGDGGNVRFDIELPAPDAIALPAGYVFTHVATADNVERRVSVERSAFGSSTPNAADWRRLMQLPLYRADLDLLAVAPDGTGASACTVYYDPATRCGEFEAVGTAPAHQRKGLSRALIIEGLRRLHRLGARRAVVQTLISNAPARALYASCGFAYAGTDVAWTKRL